MKILDYVKEKVAYFDGGMGTLLQKAGLTSGQDPSLWNIERPEEIYKVHLEYYRAGTNIVTVNSFGLNSVKYIHSDKYSMEEVIKAAVDNANRAREDALKEGVKGPLFVAFGMGPTGKLIEPLGDLSYNAAVDAYADAVKAAKGLDCDLILIETMTDMYEAKASVVAAKENSDLPVFITFAFDEKGRLLTASEPEELVAVFEGLGVDAIGINCSLGPEQMGPIVERFVKCASVPVIVNPNAGLPRVVDGNTIYDVTPERFAELVNGFAKMGASIVGGCCGTTPEHIIRLVEEGTDLQKTKLEVEEECNICSATKMLRLEGARQLEISTDEGKKKLWLLDEEALEKVDINYDIDIDKAEVLEAAKDEDMDSFTDFAMDAEDDEAEILSIKLSSSEICEAELLEKVILELQGMVKLPFMLESGDPVALNGALRCLKGKALVKIANPLAKENEALLMVALKYGCPIAE